MALTPIISEPHAARTRIGRREMRESFMMFSKDTDGNGQGGGRRLSSWGRGRNPKLYESRCVWNGSRGGSEREAITLRVVLVKRFFTLPFTIKNVKLCKNK